MGISTATKLFVVLNYFENNSYPLFILVNVIVSKTVLHIYSIAKTRAGVIGVLKLHMPYSLGPGLRLLSK